jgi:hypothetical protein
MFQLEHFVQAILCVLPYLYNASQVERTVRVKEGWRRSSTRPRIVLPGAMFLGDPLWDSVSAPFIVEGGGWRSVLILRKPRMTTGAFVRLRRGLCGEGSLSSGVCNLGQAEVAT